MCAAIRVAHLIHDIESQNRVVHGMPLRGGNSLEPIAKCQWEKWPGFCDKTHATALRLNRKTSSAGSRLVNPT